MSAVAGLITRLAVAWVQFSTRFAALVLAGALLLVGAAGWYASGHLGIDTSTADMIAERLPWRQSFIDYREAFPQLERTLVIVIDGADRDQADLFRDELVSRLQVQSELLQQVYAPGADPFFQREGLLYRDLAQLQQLSGQLVEAQPFIGRLSNDPGSAGLFGLIADALAQPPADRTGVLLQRVAAVTAAVADGQPQALSWQALMLGEDEQPARHVVVATVPEGFAAAASAIRLVRETATAIDVTVEPVTVRLTGPVALEYEELASVASGVKRSAIGAFLMVLLVLSIALRSPWLVLATLVTLIAGLVLTAGFAALAVGRLNLISVAFAVLYIGLGVDFAIHYLMRVREAVAGGVSKIDALSDSAGDVGASLIICAITTSLGFFAFFPTTFRGVAELGLISGVGMYLSLIVTLSLLPAMLRFLPVRVRATGMQVGFLAPLAYSRAFWLWAIVFLMACALTLPWVSFDSDPLNLRDPAAESVSTYRDLMRDPDHAPRALSLLVEADEAARTSRRLERLPQVSEVRGLDDLIASQQQQKLALVDELNWILGAPVAVAESKSDSAQVAAAIARLRPVLATQDLPAAGKLDAALARITPDQYGQLDRALTGTLAYRLRALSAGLQARGFGAADLPSDVSERYLTADGRQRLEILPQAGITTASAQRNFVDSVRAVTPAATGLAVVQTLAGEAVVDAFQQAFLTAIVMVALVLWLVLRRPRDVMVVLAPLMIAALATIAVMTWFGMPFNFANVIALPLLLGIGVDNGIHMVWRHRQSTMEVLGSSTALAIVFSALTTIAGFGNLAFSGHSGSASMGQVLTIGMIATTLFTLLLIPPLLRWRS